MARRGLVLITCMLALAPAAEAATRWHPPVTVSGKGATDPVVHIDSRGRALVAWAQGNSLFYAWREPRSRFGRARYLGGGGFVRSNPRTSVALSPNGVATVAYLGSDNRIGVRRARPGRSFDPPRLLGDPAVTRYPPVVATDDEGRAILTWEDRGEQQPRVMAAFVSATGAVSEPVLVGVGDDPKLAMNPAGAAVIAFKGPPAEPMAAIRPPEGAFMPPVRAPLPQSSPLAAIDALGRSVLAATPFRPPPPGAPSGGTSFSVGDPSGSFGPEQQLDPGGMVQQLLAESDGSVDFLSSHQEGVKLASRRADGTVLGPLPISAPGACAGHLSVARRGDLLATWMSSCTIRQSRAVVRLRKLGVAFGPPVAIAETGAVAPRGAVTDGDEAIVVYTHGDQFGQVHAAVREDRRDDPLPTPPEIDLDVPDELYLPDLPEIELPVRCERACRVTPTGLLHAGDETISALGRGARRLRAKARGTLSVPFAAEARTAAERAAGDGRPVWLSISVLVRGESPRPQTVTRRVELRPRR